MQQNIFKIYDGRKGFWQWDTGQKLIVLDNDVDQVHFSNNKMSFAIIKEVYDDVTGARVCDIPDVMFKTSNSVDVYAYVMNDGENKTICATKYHVAGRQIPEDYTYEEDDRFQDLVDKIESIEDMCENATSIKRFDTIDEANLWAKASKEAGLLVSVNIDGRWIAHVIDYDYSVVQICDKSALDDAINDALTKAKASGEFDGPKGDNGISITGTEINSDGELIITMSDGVVSNVGNVIGPEGKSGSAGNDGLTPFINNKGNWQVGDTDTGVSASGKNGADGVGVIKTEINDKNELVITFSDGSISNVGVVVGEKGDVGPQGVSGVYVGSGDMPDGYNVQIDPTGEALKVDQIYNPSSENPQSGKAVAEALSNFSGGGEKEWELVDDVTFTETVASYSKEFPANTYKELYIEGIFISADRATEKQNLVIGTKYGANIVQINAAFGHASYEKVYVMAHLSISPKGTYICDATASLFGFTLSGTHLATTGRMDEKHFINKTHYPSLYMSVAGQFAENTTFTVWGR